MLNNFVSFIGIFVLLGIAYLLSDNKKKINWKLVSWGIGLQLVFAFIILWTKPGRVFFAWIKDAVEVLLGFTRAGSVFVFGGLVDNIDSFGYIFAFQVLPTIIFFSSFMSVLYHLGIMQKIVVVMAKAMTKFMGASGAESLSCAANVFVGQTEAPLVIKPYIKTMTKSEVMTLMTGGMATVAGGVMAAYVGMGVDAGHLLAASIMSAPAAIVMAKLLVPEVEESQTAGDVKLQLEKTSVNVIDAAASGAADGLKLALNVAAMLLAFIALIDMVNFFIVKLSGLFLTDPLTFQGLLSYIFAPIAWIMGVPKADMYEIGKLLGIKTVLNEFVAYAELSKVVGKLSERSVVIATYALCGFANFSSIAIQIGGISALAPGKKHMLAKLGMKSMIGGTLAAFLTATIAGMLYQEPTKALDNMKDGKKVSCNTVYEKDIDYWRLISD
ncbi:MAG: NupC/NupG family nucleoside CNT transporter [Candidatus Muiribacterium halophilum]|uniref:Nucleoside permease n=1 Tax=Muiribacterium halophilum TaxID=2053465 RepID=A0A2N5ZC07_MUIH1|nr:MAG: NupC/NupG family nucleoside CNT transporter [Candidatus Muirbacterium halophilum]